MPQPDLSTADTGLGPIPEANQPGHHPPVEQDKPTGPPPQPRVDAVPSTETRHFDFRFEPVMQALGAPFGVLPFTTGVEVDDEVRIRFGPWSMRFPRDEVAGVEESTDYVLVKVAGPPHLSFADKGVTFATNRQRGLCIRLRTPQRGIDPLGLIRHPGVTVTVADIEGLRAALDA